MTLLIHQSDIGEPLREPEALPSRRRRLSTIAKRRIPGRPCIVSIHRRGTLLQPSDETVRTRKAWKSTLVGPQDVVLITYLPLGGGAGGGGASQGKQIGAAVAMIAIAVAAPYLIGALGIAALGTATSLTLAGKILAMGIIAGAGYLISKAMAPKANKEKDDRPVYGVSGGGNVPRAGDRIPVNYGRTWHNPDLSQPDYFVYEGDDQVLYKRMTLGAGKYELHTIRVGQATMWDGALLPPFTTAEIEIIPPGGTSTLVPSSVYSADAVAGIELPRPQDNPAYAGPYSVTPVGVETDTIQIDWSFPQGVYSTHPKKSQTLPHTRNFQAQYAPINEDDIPIGPWQTLVSDVGSSKSTRALRYTRIVNVPKGRYAVRAFNGNEEIWDHLEEAGVRAYDMIMWDGLRAHLGDEPVRPQVTELAMKIRSGKATGSATTFSDIWVETTKILPVWNGFEFVEQPTRKAIWAAVDALRNQDYGGAVQQVKLDLARFFHYASTVTTNDTFDGSMRGPISLAEALSTILGVMRAEPMLLGDVWSITRDEPRALRKHVVTRRQIIKDTSAADFDMDMTDGASDIIVEYNIGGDPRRRAEYRETIGAQTLTPRRMNAFGVTSHDHAVMIARWTAAAAYYRREARNFTTEMAGRMMGRNDSALIDTWFLDNTKVAGIEERSGFTLTLDTDIDVPAGAHAVLRNSKGQDWGPVAITAGAETGTIVVSSADAQVIGQTTGESFTSLFSRGKRSQPITVLIGTLNEVQTPYLIRSAKYEGTDRLAVTALYDAPEVWAVLGEAVPPPPPIAAVVLEEGKLAPILPWVRGQVVQKTTALVLDWSVGRARGAERYVVDVAYGEDAPFETISNGPATEGSYVVEYAPNIELKIRAYAVNALGVFSQPLYATAQLFRPLIDSEIVRMQVQLEQLTDQLRKDIQAITEIAENSIQTQLKNIRDRIEELGNQAVSETVTSYTNELALAEIRDYVGANVGSATAAILEERTVRATETEALAAAQTTFLAEVAEAKALISEEQEARATADSAQASQLTSLSTTVGGHTATLTTYGTSIDGISVQYGVVAVIDGQTGGYVLTGMRRLDGTVSFSLGVRGDLIVDGTIFGQKIATNAILAYHITAANITTEKINGYAVDTFRIAQGAVSQQSIAQGEGTVTAYIQGRYQSKLIMRMSWFGNGWSAATPNGSVASPTGMVYLNGVHIANFVMTAVMTGSSSSPSGGGDFVVYNTFTIAAGARDVLAVLDYEGLHTVTITGPAGIYLTLVLEESAR